MLNHQKVFKNNKARFFTYQKSIYDIHNIFCKFSVSLIVDELRDRFYLYDASRKNLNTNFLILMHDTDILYA